MNTTYSTYGLLKVIENSVMTGDYMYINDLKRLVTRAMMNKDLRNGKMSYTMFKSIKMYDYIITERKQN